MKILEVRHITKRFSLERGMFKKEAGSVTALSDVSFCLEEFGTLGIVGESGCGKTTLAKIILKLIPADSGELLFNTASIRDFRKDVQIIFQNAYNSLNPRMRIKDMLAEPLLIHKTVPPGSIPERSAELLRMVGMETDALRRYPAEFSGGQRQRLCIARSLASGPKLIVLDEPISSLDLTIQAKLVDLFLSLKQDLRLTYVFISHNLAVIKRLADRVIVMRSGKILEEGESSRIFREPAHPYTKALLEAARG